MADYIRKSILSQAYAHIEGVSLDQGMKADFEVQIAEYQKPRAKILLGKEIIPEIRTRDGSLKVYSTVYGSLSDALGEFTDFQQALNMLYASSKMLADACNLESLFLSRGKKNAMVRSEARTGIVKSTKDMFDRVLLLIEAKQPESHVKITSNIADIEKKVIFLNEQLDYGRDKELIWSKFSPLLKKLSSTIHKSQVSPNSDRLTMYKNTLTDISKQIEKFRIQGDRDDEL
ncbi:hypothetical protein RugamoR64_33240 [Duganella rhizosphaerae]|uniref:hypothetical protein n=1 Tax=Duganella rhizosphaerae TaxID=2885763 RepID=UPI0030E91599